ncbi:hypothetical protein Salat_1866300 [Sesamum alatum]|uniref:Uncharacterized protein n=1 Tax=Sesamum alatum TaxID=300844 RepID=A0AAE2CHY9_9LAMI|nr:hypothetical protein Salat_1866300 [Sesamum alatum]
MRFSVAVAGVFSGDAADGLLLNRWSIFRCQPSRPATEHLPQCSYSDTENYKMPKTDGPPTAPTPAAPPVKRSYANVVQHNSTTSFQFDPNRAAKKTFCEDECGAMGKVSSFKGDPAKKVQEQNIGNKDKEFASVDNDRPEQELTEGNITMENSRKLKLMTQIT